MSQSPRESLPTEAQLAIQAGRRIEAVKIVREQRGLGLKEAMELVDAAARTETGSLSKVNAREDSGLLRLLAVLVVIGGIAAALLLL